MAPRILLVDDNPEIHERIGAQLEEGGFEVVHAEDGFTAINLVFTEMPDAVVLDIKMPRINGYQVCRLLKDHQATKDIPIILMTREVSVSFVKDPVYWSFYTGADGYIDKDYESDVSGVVKSFLKERKGVEGERTPAAPLSEMEIMIQLSRLLDKQLYLDVKRLEELNERKNAFVANVSHELKSPLTIIKGYATNLGDGLLGSISDQQKAALERVNSTVDRLTRLITDLLDIAKIEAGKMQLREEKVNCSELLGDILQTYSETLKEYRINIKKELPGEAIYIKGDKDRLTQVFINILDNSIKYTPEEGVISVRLLDQGRSVQFEIEDNGPGLSPENLDKIFDKFVRIKSETREGTGLGLPIAKDIITLHKGKIWAETKEGQGSRFIVVLPKEARY